MPLHLDETSTPGPQLIDWQRVALAYEARVRELEQALRIIAGREQCFDNLMGNVDVAIAVLDRKQ